MTHLSTTFRFAWSDLSIRRHWRLERCSRDLVIRGSCGESHVCEFANNGDCYIPPINSFGRFLGDHGRRGTWKKVWLHSYFLSGLGFTLSPKYKSTGAGTKLRPCYHFYLRLYLITDKGCFLTGKNISSDACSFNSDLNPLNCFFWKAIRFEGPKKIGAKSV